MRNKTNLWSSIFLMTIFLTGCATVEPTAGKKFDVESKIQCAKICKQAEMSFDALVVVGGMAGCVCGNRDSKNLSSSGGVMGGQVSAIAAAQAAHAAHAAAAAHAAQQSQMQQRRR